MPMDEWEIHPDDLSPAQREVADLIGFENYLKLIDVYAAETIYIPKRDSFERIARNQRIVEEYNGDNLKALAKKYNLTTVTVRTIVDEKHRESTTRRICGPIRTRICRGIGCRNITLSPKSHPKEAAPAPMKRRTIATQTTQTKEITYD